MRLSQVDRDFSPAGWYPQAPLKKIYPDSVPSHIARAASEAHGCFSVGHYQAAAAMARATVEASARSCRGMCYELRIQSMMLARVTAAS